MYLKKIDGPRSIELPDGTHISLADLPPYNTKRWVASRKAMVIKAVVAGLISKSGALKQYGLSEEEFECWCRLVQKHGINGLKTTHLHSYRE